MKQPINELPRYPVKQVHIATWFMARQLVLGPQDPTHGSTHFSLTHALSLGQSSLMVHSGEQRGGAPIYPGLQAQRKDPPKSLHEA